jgi:glycosidase
MSEPGWVEHAIWWHVYPLGFVGAFPATRRRVPTSIGCAGSSNGSTTPSNSVRRVSRWPDLRLAHPWLRQPRTTTASIQGSVDDGDFDALVDEAHRRGLRVLLDGVFNHVGTDHPRYRDAAAGADTTWFRRKGDDFETFEGHGELIAFNHDSPDVVDYTVDVMKHWLRRGADGWRLDAAFAVPDRFWAQVLPRVREEFDDAWFVGEVIHGDYAGHVRAAGFDSITQYELWKAIWSSLNDGNFHELDHAMKRHNEFLDVFVPLTFIGNHDVTRIASKLENTRHLEHALAILLTIGGTPSVYAGDESAYTGIKEERAGGDDAVRPEFTYPLMGVDDRGQDIFRLHQYLIGLRRRHPWLHTARTSVVTITNTQYVYQARRESDTLLIALNIDDAPMAVSLNELGFGGGRVVAGSGAPPQDVVSEIQIEPHGWLIIEPS